MKIRDISKGDFRINLYEAIAGSAAIALMLFVLITTFMMRTDHKETGYYYELRNGWTLTTPDATYEEVELPMKVPAKAGQVVVLERTLPDRIEGAECVAFREIHQNIRVYINNELRDEYNIANERLKWNNPISRNFYIELRPEDSRAQLRIEGVATKDGKRTITKVMYGDKVGIFFNYYVRSQLVGIVFGIIFIAMGIIGILAGQILHIATRGRVKVDSMGWAMLIVAIWNMTQSNYREYFFPNLGMAKAIPYFSLLVLPMFLIIYLDWVQRRRHKKILGIFVITSFLNLVLWFVLVTLRIASPEDCAWIAFAFLYAAFAISIYTFIVDRKNHVPEKYGEVMAGFVASAIGGIVQIVTYVLSIEKADGMYLGTGFAFLTCMVFINATRMLMRLRIEKESAETKSRFLAAMSHELRTPINAIMGLNEAIKHESTEEAIVTYAEDVDKAGKLLLHLVNDILDFTKIDSGNLKLVCEPFDIRKCVMVCYSIAATRAEGKNLEICVNIDKEMPSMLYGDELRLQQVIINILCNAVKYTDEGKVEANLSFERQNERDILLKYSVKDTGRGIRQEDMAMLFDNFTRADERANRNIEGTGLGLPITKGIVDLMGGSIDVQSTYGVGSCFSIEVPIGVMSWDKVGDFDIHSEKEKADISIDTGETLSFPGLNMLVVDDVEMNLKVIRSLMKNSEAELDFALTGENAFSLCKKKKYDIIFMDHMMPEMDGIETLKKIRESDDSLNKDTPVIVMTANAAADAEEDYQAIGFADYIMKPFGMGPLKKTIQKNIRSDSKDR